MESLLAPTAASLGADLRQVCDRLHQDGWRAVQLSAAMPGTRPRDLNASARRDLAAMLRRMELVASGLDLWIPREHFLDSSTVERAVDAIAAGCELAHDLSIDSLSVQLPEAEVLDPAAGEAILAAAAHRGVMLADHRVCSGPPESTAAGLDPAACLSMDRDPVEDVIMLGSSLVSPRLSDLLTTGLRGPVGAPEGRLDLAAYRAAVVTIARERPVVLDLRQLESPWNAMQIGRQAWAAAGTGGP
ncbi:MAG: hypothetical protein MK116_06045 [Phycisphaerales bacterium]|nr:hypothetical protein [Phycisphaerales bacterium]